MVFVRILLILLVYKVQYKEVLQNDYLYFLLETGRDLYMLRLSFLVPHLFRSPYLIRTV